MLNVNRNILTGGADLPFGTAAQTYRIKRAGEAWELRGYADLRRRTFCDEQRLFDGSDHDEHDVVATPIVAVSYAAVCDDEVIGCVRIYPDHGNSEDDDDDEQNATWYGSRLSVSADWRGARPLVAGLIRAAVCTARARGCTRFLATVQQQNAALFRRLHWHALHDVTVRGRQHVLMQADLAFYLPSDIAAAGMPRLSVRAAS